MTSADSQAKRARIVRQAAWTCFLVLTAFALAGSVIFEEVRIAPRGIPMLAGAGAISTVMAPMAQPGGWWQGIPVFAAIAVQFVLNGLADLSGIASYRSR